MVGNDDGAKHYPSFQPTPLRCHFSFNFLPVHASPPFHFQLHADAKTRRYSDLHVFFPLDVFDLPP